MMTGKALDGARGSPLRQRMIEQLRIANLAETTQSAYLFEIERLARHYGISPAEFIRRFLLYVLPERLHRIRHFGILANSCRARTLESAREALGTVGCTLADHGSVEDVDGEEDREAGTAAPLICPHCGAVLRHVNEIPRQQASHPARAPPGARQNQTPQP